MKYPYATLLLLLLAGLCASPQQQLSFRFANPQVIPGPIDVFQFDVQVKAAALGTFHRDLQIYLNYNPLAFGENVFASEKTNIVPLDLLSDHYGFVNVADNADSRIAIITEANEELNLPGSSDFFNLVPVSYTGLLQVQMEVLDDGFLTGIYFDEDLMDGGQFMQSSSSTDPQLYFNPNSYENSLAAFSLAGQTLNLQPGWTGISSYMGTVDANVEELFAPLSNELIILQNFYGFYYPDNNTNTLGSWESSSGYMVKVNSTCQLKIFGNAVNGGNLLLTDGWNLIPVLNPCGIETEQLFIDALPQLLIVKEVAGTGIFWPSMNINTLPVIEPGKSYFVKVSGNQSITFPSCE